MKKIYIILLVFFMGATAVTAQDGKIEKGNEEFENLAFIDAREAYLKVVEDGYRSEDMLKKLGDSYYFTADYANASKWYGALYEYDNNVDADYLYRYAQSLKSSQQYDASDRIMEKFYAAKGSDYRAKLFVNERNYLNEIEQQSGRFELGKVGFNSKLSDFAPAFNQGSLTFASNRSGRGSSKRVHDWNNQPFLDIYQLNTVEGNNSEEASKLDKKINTKYHESTAVYTKDGQTMYFTRNNFTNKDYQEDSNGTNRLKLYRANRVEGSWEVEELPFNSNEYSVAHPALSKDEKTLYFASDMPGGRGLSDLYKVDLGSDSYGTPVSLGDEINTEGRETFPFISGDNKIYFASDGHPGLGGLDVFVADMTADGFGDVYNVGKPVNSPMDDFTFIINETTGLGYFASNRENGVGDDDIYSFKSIKPLMTKCAQTVTGVVRDQKTNEIIPNATVYLLNDTNDIMNEMTAGADGSFSFELDCARQYCVRGIKEGYSTAEKCFATGSKMTDAINKTLFMDPGTDLTPNAPAGIGSDLVNILGLNMIYFDLDKDFIRPDAEMELRKVIAVMKLYPQMKIDVRSHTDSRSPDAYNIDLSDRRAKSTIDYLVNIGGIDASRLTGQGYGETQLTNGCINGAPCSEAAHQRNRRSEFIIVQ